MWWKVLVAPVAKLLGKAIDAAASRTRAERDAYEHENKAVRARDARDERLRRDPALAERLRRDFDGS